MLNSSLTACTPRSASWTVKIGVLSKDRQLKPEQSNRFGDPIRKAVEVDEIDRRILHLLSEDARLSTRALSRQIGMSPGSISERISRLEREGVLLGYHARIEASTIGFGMQAIVGLRATQASLQETVDRLASIEEVETVYVVTGEWDLIVHIRVRDHHHLSEVLFDRLWGTSGFQQSETMIILHQRKGPGLIPG
jgi:DNA-binding Lrp family transcriptional regulator